MTCIVLHLTSEQKCFNLPVIPNIQSRTYYSFLAIFSGPQEELLGMLDQELGTLFDNKTVMPLAVAQYTWT